MKHIENVLNHTIKIDIGIKAGHVPRKVNVGRVPVSKYKLRAQSSHE